jgi:hypothetical protein
VFVNLAAIAGPVTGRPDAMMHVNYKGESESPHAARFANSHTEQFHAAIGECKPWTNERLHSHWAVPAVHGSCPPFEAHTAVSTTPTQRKWEGCLHLTALLTTLVPPTREWSYWLRLLPDSGLGLCWLGWTEPSQLTVSRCPLRCVLDEGRKRMRCRGSTLDCLRVGLRGDGMNYEAEV